MTKSKARGKKAATMVRLAQASIRQAVTTLHNEIHYLRWCEGKQGEAALAELHAEYTKLAREVTEAGVVFDDLAGGILDQLDTIAVAAKLTGPKS